MYEKKNDYIIVAIVLFICIAAGWLYADSHRNDGQYHHTDKSVERIEERMSAIESRLDTMSDRLTETQKTVERITTTVVAGRENAEAIAGGITEAERRLDSAIQASGRIKNRIEDIEAEYRKGTKNP